MDWQSLRIIVLLNIVIKSHNMRTLYYSLLLLFVCMIANSQKSDQGISVTSPRDFSMPSFSIEGSITKEFSPLSEKAVFSMFLYNYSKNAGNDFIKQLFKDSLYRNGNSKTYTVVEQSQKNVNIIYLQIGSYTFTYPVRSVSDKEILIYAFNTESNIENKIVPIALLIDYKGDNDEKAINAVKRTLECRQLEDFNASDIEYLKSNSNLLNVVTYKMESKNEK